MSARRILFWTHLATGCVAGIIVLIMSVTGVLLAYERQITAWVDRDFHSTPANAGSARLPIDAMLTGFVDQNHVLPSAITVRADPAAPAEASLGRDHVYLVDVYTGSILGESSPRIRAFFQKVENWHRWLGASNENRAVGRAVTGACNFGFFFLVVSGPFLWLPRKWSWQALKTGLRFRGGLSGRARDYNWHNVIGIWCAAPLFLIVLSGVVMSYPWANNLLYRLTGSPVPVQGNGPRAQAQPGRGQGKEGGKKAGRDSRQGESRQREGRREGETVRPSLAGLNPLWEKAERQISGWQSITLRTPPNGRGPMTFTIDTGSGGRPDQRAQLTLDARTAEVVWWEPFSSYNTGRRLRAWFRFIHTGEAGGVAGETVATVASAGAAVLVWTGLWLACRRWLAWKRRRSGVNSVKPEQVMSVSA